MGDLPAPRVIPSRPFTVTCIDYVRWAHCYQKWVELSRPVICHLVGVRENGKQLDESIFCKIGGFNRLKNQLIFAVTGERVKVSI
jgi:hypothetical protein